MLVLRASPKRKSDRYSLFLVSLNITSMFLISVLFFRGAHLDCDLMTQRKGTPIRYKKIGE